MSSVLVLREATVADEQAVLAAHRATSPEYPSFLHGHDESLRFPEYLEVLDQARRERVTGADDDVPETFLFAFVEGHVVGRATEILRQALGIARRSLGLRRVLVTCDTTNTGSIRTIEKNGGVLDDVVDGPDLDVPVRRYWIDLP